MTWGVEIYYMLQIQVPSFRLRDLLFEYTSLPSVCTTPSKKEKPLIVICKPAIIPSRISPSASSTSTVSMLQWKAVFICGDGLVQFLLYSLSHPTHHVSIEH